MCDFDGRVRPRLRREHPAIDALINYDAVVRVVNCALLDLREVMKRSVIPAQIRARVEYVEEHGIIIDNPQFAFPLVCKMRG